MASVGVQFFEVVKVGRFRQKQDQVAIVEFNDETGGRVRVLNSEGEERRVVLGTDVLGVDKATTGEGASSAPVAVMKYFNTATKGGGGGGDEHTQTYVFDSEELRDAFVGALVRLNPRVSVSNRQRGVSQVIASPTPGMLDRLAASSPSSPPPEVMSPSEGGSTRHRSATVASGSRAVNSRVFGASSGSSGGGEALPAVRRTQGRRFFVMVENQYGCREPRVVALSESGGLLQLFDSHETIRDEFAVLQLRDLYVHSVDDTVARLSFAVGDGVSTTRTDVITVFGTRNQRRDFVSALETLVLTVSPGSPVPWTTHPHWAQPLPVHLWHRFSVTKVNKGLKNARYVLLVGPENSQLRLIRLKDTAASDDNDTHASGEVVRGDAAVETVIGVAAGQLVVERVAGQALRVRISTNCASDGFGGRSFTTFEFRSVSDREAFIASVNQLAVVPSTMPKHLLSTPIHSTPALPPVMCPASLWGTRWPTLDVRIFIGTWNVSSSPPPANMSEFLAQPAPSSMPAAGSCIDMFVIGLQELGPSGNRDAWGAALFSFLNAEPTGVAAGLIPIPVAPPRYTGRREKDVGRCYSLVAFESMWELGLWVFVRTVHCNDITCVTSGYEATGISLAKELTGKQFGNKGGVAVSFLWCDVPLCFVNSHLAARPTRVKERESDYCQIADRLRIGPSHDPGLDLLHQHDHVFWFGDLNYRVDLPFERVVGLVKDEDWGQLLENDQLRREMAAQKVFSGFVEAPVGFPPTYRWNRDEVTFSNKNEQSPSYTDRILYRSLPGVQSSLSVTSSGSNNTLFGSDHRPVTAQFTLQLQQKYSCSSIPKRHIKSAVATFFTEPDRASGLRTPAFEIESLRVKGFDATLGIVQAYLSCAMPLLETPVCTAVVDVPSTAVAFEWKDSCSILPVMWDPRVLVSQHVAVVLKGVGGDGRPVGSTGNEDVVCQGTIPLAPVCARIATIIADKQRRANAVWPGEDDEVDCEPPWLTDDDKLSVVFSQPGVPFALPLLRRGQQVGLLEGTLRLVASDGRPLASAFKAPIFTVKQQSDASPSSISPPPPVTSGPTIPKPAIAVKAPAADAVKVKAAPMRTRIRMAQPEASSSITAVTAAVSVSPALAAVPVFVSDVSVEEAKAELLRRLPPFGSVLGTTPLHDKSDPSARYPSRDALPSLRAQ